MKAAFAAAALTLSLATGARASDTAALLGELNTVSAELVQRAEPARTAEPLFKVRFLAGLVVRDFRQLQGEVQRYADRHGIELPAGGALDDLDDDFLEELVTRCETTLRPVEDALRENEDPQLEALLRLAIHALNDTRGDARRARGEYVPLYEVPGR